MYDTVIVEGLKLKTTPEIKSWLKQNNASLPNEFQTKGLDNALLTYKIDSNGQLWINARKETGRKIPYKNNFENWKDNRSFLERLYTRYFSSFGALTNAKPPRLIAEIKYVWQKVNVTNTIEIYDYVEIGGRYVDVSYITKIVDGKLKSIKLNEGKLEPVSEAKERKARDEAWEQKMKETFVKRKEFTSKWYYPILKETYNPFIFFSRLLVQKICNKIVTWSYKWTGV